MTIFVGLTGGIAAGKSAALKAFEDCGAAVFSTDLAAHRAMEQSRVEELLRERWGEAVLDADGGFDRGAIAEIVFSDPEELRWLESVLHPEVRRELTEWRQELDPGVAVAVVEVPLLFESGMADAFDTTVAVVAGDEIRKDRLAERGQKADEEREGRQLPQGEKAEKAEHLVRNEGSLEDLAAEIAALYETLITQSESD